jgi:hypothetical protein
MNPRRFRLFLVGLFFLFIIAALIFPLTGRALFDTKAGAQTNNPRAQAPPARPLPNYDAFAESRGRDGAGARGANQNSVVPQVEAGRPVQFEPRLGVPTFLWASRQGPARAPAAQNAQVRKDGAAEAAREQLGGYASYYRLSGADVASAKVAAVHDTGRGAVIVKFKQEVGGVEVFRDELNVVMNRDLQLVALTGYLTGDEAGVGLSAQEFNLQPAEALSKALEDLTGTTLSPSAVRGTASPAAQAGTEGESAYSYFTASLGGGTRMGEPARVKQVMYHAADGFVPAYYVEAEVLVTSADETSVTLDGPGVKTESLYYAYVISAVDGRLLFRKNLTETDGTPYSYRVWADPATLLPYDTPEGNGVTPKVNPTPDGVQPPFLAPNLVTLANFPFSKNDPWLPDGSVATLGNNVDAYVDLVTGDGYGPVATAPYGGAPACANPAVGSATCGDFRAGLTAPNVFDTTFDTALAPNSSGNQRRAATQQLFYDVNFLHDWFYDAGFDEAAGNAQTDNYGRGGIGNDSIKAEAQDFSGTDNANMSTPSDGGRPRMQMFVFNPNNLKVIDILSPPAIAGQRATGIASAAGPQTFDLTGDIVRGVFNPGQCTYSNAASMAGKIVMVDYGTGSCFGPDMSNAVAAGAAGFVLVWQSSNPNQVVNFTGSFAALTIPWGSLSWNNGLLVKGQLAASNTVSVRMRRTGGAISRDGTIDNQIVAHEWGHYISNRLIADAAGLGNNQGNSMGEGWGDFTAMLLTVREDDANVPSNANWAGVYALATYATGGAGNAWSPDGNGDYFGIRRYPYSTDLTKNPLTFKHITNGVALPAGPPVSFGADGGNNAEVHSSGEVWATMLWECYASLLRDTQGAAPRLTFTEAQTRMKNYLVAAYKMTPVNPTFLEARDALLVAAYAYDPEDGRLFVQAFAKRGAGVGAVAPDRFSLNHSAVTESFSTGAGLAYVGASLDDSVDGCDGDGYLDNTEKGLLTVTLKNAGDADLFNIKATASSANAHVTFPQGATINFAPARPGESVTGSVAVTIAGAVGIETTDFTVTFEDTGAPVAPAVAHFFARLNVAEIPASTATDPVESRLTTWNIAGGSPTGPDVQWTRVSTPGSGTNHQWYAPDASKTSDQRLTSPVFTVDGSGSVNFQFDHSFSFEFDSTANYDGGVIEMSVNGGAFTDIGGTSYNGTITNGAGFTNPIRGRSGFVRSSNGTQHVSVTKAVAPGSTVQMRFRAGSDGGGSAAGWYVDNIAFTGVVETPFTTLVGDSSICHPPGPAPGVTILFSPESLPAAATGQPYTATVTASGGTGSYTYNVSPVILPQGLSSGPGGGGVQITGTPAHASVSLVTIKATDNNGVQGSKTYTLTINKGSSTTTVTVSDAAFDGNPHGATAAVTGFGGLSQSLSVTYAGRNGTTYGPSTTAPTNAGDYTASASFAGDADHNAGSDSKDFQITKAAQTINFAAPADKTFGDAPFNVSATGGGSGNPVTFAAVGNCTSGAANGSTITITSAGSCTVTASQAGNSNFNAASDVARSFTINKAGQTITFGTLSDKTFGDADFSVSATVPSNLVVSFGATGNCSVSGNTVHLTGAGSCTVTTSQAGNDNYNAATDVPRSFNINKQNQTINFGTLSDKTFGDASFTVSATGGASGNAVTFGSQTPTVCSVSGSTLTILAAGTCTVRASQAGDANYDAAPDIDRSFDVAKAGTTTTITVSDATFDGNPHGASAAATGPGGLSQSLSVTYVGRNGTTYGPLTTSPTNAGDYTASASFAGDADHNSSSGSADFRITKAGQAITFATLVDKTFGDAPFNVSATGGGSGNPVTFTATGNCTSGGTNGATITITGAGSCTVTASQAGDSNFAAASDVPRTFQIAKAATTTGLASSVNPSDLGQSVTFTATVTSTAGTPIGTVTFKDGATTLGTGGLNASGAATLSTSALTASAHNVTAEYGGAADYASGVGTLSGGQTVKAAPTLTIGDVMLTEGDGGTQDAVFAVTLSAASNLTVTASFATSDGTGAAPGDYTAATGTLAFAPGETLKTVTVKVKGDTSSESDETFFVTLSGPVNAALGGTGKGIGTVVNDDATGGRLRFSAAEYGVAEGAGSVVITVERGGDTSNAASVEYATDDGSVPEVFVPCSATTGVASQRCDFTAAAGRLDFAAGETSKTFSILLSDDTFVEGSETLHLVLRNAGGGGLLGTPAASTLTITDDDVASSGNPIDDAAFFVRQHYHDFLNREPDTAGLQFWTNEITSCGTNAACVDAKRVNVSGAFFLSIEFQNTGYLVYRANVAAFGPTRVGGAVPVTSDEFLPDVRQISQGVVVGPTGWEVKLEANTQAYFKEFVGRAAFKTAFPSALTPAQFVDALNANAGGVLSTAERDALVVELTANNNDDGRASVLRKVADDADLKAAHTNRAFVLMQYFGYLRRDPNAAPDANFNGYTFWLTKLNQFGGDFVKAEMVRAFITSDEYRKRFGQ